MHKSINAFEKVLQALKKDLATLDQLLQQHAKGRASDLTIWKKFQALHIKYPANALLWTRFLTWLQLTNDKQVMELCSLKDIGHLYKMVTDVYKDDPELHVEHIHFLFNIENKEKHALAKLGLFRKRIERKLQNLHL